MKCATNLRSIGQAYGVYLVDQQARGGTDLQAAQWAFFLRGYFKDLAPIVFLCPEDLNPDWSWPYMIMENYWPLGNSRTETVFELDPVWLDKAHSDFTDKPKIWKVNDDVYQDMLSDASLRRNMPKYTPGSNPNKYWYIYEDIGDDDFYDFDLGMTEIRPGYVSMTAKHWANAHSEHYLIDPDGTRHWVWDEFGPLEVAVPQTSFGMSSRGHAVRPGESRLLFLDYEAKVCNVLADVGADEGWDELQAPRHLGQVNAVRGDGAVVHLWPDEINPESKSTDVDYHWGDTAPSAGN